MLLNLIYYGDPLLRRKADPVVNFDSTLKELINNMEETLLKCRGLGLAAPQVGHSLRVFLINIPEKGADGHFHPTKTWVFVNPKILEVSTQQWTEQEGCLSIPKFYEQISRPYRVKVEAYDAEGELFTHVFEGWEAKAWLHENDHINGVLFIDRLPSKKRKEIEPKLNQIKNLYYLKKK